MNNLFSQAHLFFKRNSATILSCVGVTGVVVTSVMAVKATPKALEKVRESEKEKGTELTKLEKAKVVVPVYIPTALVGASTIACILGANVLNKRTQASLVSAYAFLDNSFKEYKKKANELYGEDADSYIREELAKDKYDEEDAPVVSEGKQLFFDNFSMRYFESTPEDVLKAELAVNKRLAMTGYATLNDWYDNLGIDRFEPGEHLGWSIEAGAQWYLYSWVDFEHETFKLEDNLEVCMITMESEPTSDYNFY